MPEGEAQHKEHFAITEIRAFFHNPNWFTEEEFSRLWKRASDSKELYNLLEQAYRVHLAGGDGFSALLEKIQSDLRAKD